MSPRRLPRRRAIPKRALDVAASALGLCVLLPVLVVAAAAVKMDSPGPVLFRQTRVGRAGRPFRIFKFRSMVVRAPALGTSLTIGADARVTRTGAFLRRHKLDELPQLLNVLRGEMSLVGPRPEVPELMQAYDAEHAALMTSVAPGMTDYASILLRDESTLLARADDPQRFYRDVIMPLKFRYCRAYIDQAGLLQDLHIILATVLLLVRGSAPAWLQVPALNSEELSLIRLAR